MHLRHDTLNLPRTSVLAKIRYRCRYSRIPTLFQDVVRGDEVVLSEITCHEPQSMSVLNPHLDDEIVLSLASITNQRRFDYLVISLKSIVVCLFADFTFF
jgi:hypothetical protein